MRAIFLLDGYNVRCLAFLIRVRGTYERNSVIEGQLSEALFDRNFRWLEVYGLNFSGPRFEPTTAAFPISFTALQLACFSRAHIQGVKRWRESHLIPQRVRNDHGFDQPLKWRHRVRNRPVENCRTVLWEQQRAENPRGQAPEDA